MTVRTGLLLAVMQLLAALLATAGVRLGYVDQGMAVRITMVAIGLMLLVNANLIPKTASHSPRAMAVQRFLGWSMGVGALVWTALWLLAPMEIATVGAPAAVVLGILTAVGYGLRARPRATLQ
ncbi:MAG: hypothetical protein IT299_07790 [Dehalococcoidia bacterium]|nr:hypothetical protein [Dehalococcoidia bacterium]